MGIVSCTNRSGLHLSLSNVNESEDTITFDIIIDDVLIAKEDVVFSNISPSFNEVSIPLENGEYRIEFNVGEVNYKMNFFHEDKTFIYSSYFDSLEVPKLSAIISKEPFKHQ